jgi:hypothetical protein
MSTKKLWTSDVVGGHLSCTSADVHQNFGTSADVQLRCPQLFCGHLSVPTSELDICRCPLDICRCAEYDPSTNYVRGWQVGTRQMSTGHLQMCNSDVHQLRQMSTIFLWTSVTTNFSLAPLVRARAEETLHASRVPRSKHDVQPEKVHEFELAMNLAG